jgi:hypothetical protein
MFNIAAAFFIAALANFAWATACFDDENRQALDFQQTQGALLYVWSPRMVLSAQHAASAQRQAQLQGLRFVPLHDAGVPQAEVQAALQRLRGLGFDAASNTHASNPHAGRSDSANTPREFAVAKPAQNPFYTRSANALVASQPLCANSLLERDALRHFPTAFVLQSSGLHRYPIIGAMPDAAWARSIAQRLYMAAPPRVEPAASASAAPNSHALADSSTNGLALERCARSEAQR